MLANIFLTLALVPLRHPSSVRRHSQYFRSRRDRSGAWERIKIGDDISASPFVCSKHHHPTRRYPIENPSRSPSCLLSFRLPHLLSEGRQEALREPPRARRKRELPPGLSKRDQAILRSVKKRAHYLDKGFHICGMRFGWTFFISLIPIVGDVVDASLNYLLVVRKARKADIPNWLLRRMLFNNAVSAGVSLIPIAGDLVLAMYKANSRNAALLEEFLRIRGDEFLKRGGVVEDPKAKKGLAKSKKTKKAPMSDADAEQVKPGAGMTPTEFKNVVDAVEAKNSKGAAAMSASSSKKKGSGSGSSGSGFNLFGSRSKKTTAAAAAAPVDKGRFVENMDSDGPK
ncbi:unnamed protein product [Cyclocybe aegerita]|uniref:Uncharacterized protein n=1 Tax=Cyclocybe aegerita TaxID=1973307 RepID=A0A8S0W8I5_CYCAE|nr:unnamed protein product [Cyclocybe aegerita]